MGLAGAVAGFTIVDRDKRGKEAGQGGSAYLAAGHRALMPLNAISPVNHSLRLIPHSGIRAGVQTFAALAALATSCGILRGTASAQGHDELIRQALTGRLKPLNAVERLPTTWMARHGATAAKVTAVTVAAAMPFLGLGTYAAGILLPMGLGYLNERKLLPEAVRRLLDNYSSSAGTICTLLGGTIIDRACLALGAFSQIPRVQQMVSNTANRWMGGDAFAASLEQLNGPIPDLRALSKMQILTILNAHPYEFSIHPAHLNKAVEIIELPESRNFDELISMCNQINWKERSRALYFRLWDDQRWMMLLAERKGVQAIASPTTERRRNDAIREPFDIYMNELANGDMPGFLESVIKTQLQQLVDGLTGKIAVAGFLGDLEIARNSMAKIMGHMQKLLREKQMMDLSDNLLRLAVDGGGYCAAGIKNTAKEILDSIEEQGAAQDPTAHYETSVRKILERSRQQVANSMYQEIVQTTVKTMASKDAATAVEGEVHVHDTLGPLISWNFVPKIDLSLEQQLIWNTPPYRIMQHEMCLRYMKSITDVFQELGDVLFWTHLRAQIHQNPALSDDDKEQFEEMFSDEKHAFWETDNGQTLSPRFKRLLLVMMGILDIKEAFLDWEVVEEVVEAN